MNHKSMYLVEAQLKESIFGIIFILIIGTYFLLRKKFQNDENPGSGNSTQNHLGTTVFYCLAIAVFWTDSLTWISMKKNYKETIGTTLGTNNDGLIKYEYFVDDKKFNSIGEKTYPFNNKFPVIDKNGGKYIVVYDSIYPEISLIDFNQRIK